ncbi:MAG: glycosyltransferase family 9 protein [Candidatus Buchananbacteria bacterium]
MRIFNTKKLEIFFVLLYCFLYCLIRGKANKIVMKPKNILVAQTAGLGDMVCTTPMFRAIKNKYPECKVFVLGSTTNQELLQGHPDVDKYFSLNHGVLELAKIFRREGIDFACSAFPDFATLAAMYLAGIPAISMPRVIGEFCPQYTKAYQILTKLVLLIPHYARQYAAREYLRLLEPIGIRTKDITKHIVYSNSAKQQVISFLGKQKVNLKEDLLIGIFPSAGNKIKNWSPINFAKLGNYLYQKYSARIVIMGGKNDEQEVKETIVNLDSSTQVINTHNLFNLDQLKALISVLTLFISVDSGPIYLAEALGVPTVDIIGPVDENDQPPVGLLHKIVKASREKSAMYVMNARIYDKQEAKRQIEEISLPMVIKETEGLLKLVVKSTSS